MSDTFNLQRFVEAQEREYDQVVEELFGYPDFYKFRSCMTLFAACTPGNGIFREALDAFFPGEPDQTTIGILGGMG